MHYDEVTNYIVTAPLKQVRPEKIGEISINNVFSNMCSRHYDYGFGQCIYVFINELLIQEIRYTD